MKKDNERLLSWLQTLYLTKLVNIDFNITVGDNEIDSYNSFEKITFIPGIIKIYNVSNPGWSLIFFNNVSYIGNPGNEIEVNCGLSLIDSDSREWFYAVKTEEAFNTGGGPLYLSVLLEAFRCFIEQEKFALGGVERTDLIKFRDSLKKDNPLLCWLEEFYYSCCDTDWEHMYGYSLISLKDGWLMTLSVEELYYEDEPFERIMIEEEGGNVECYMLRSQFIIRAHFGGLITGIKLFKEWIEGQPKYEYLRKDV